MARRYEFYFRLAITIFYERALRVSKILSSSRRVMFFLLYRQKGIDKIVDLYSPKSNCHGSNLQYSITIILRNNSELNRALLTMTKCNQSFEKCVIDLVTVFDAILTCRQTREKLQCLYENLTSNNFRKTALLKKKKKDL